MGAVEWWAAGGDGKACQAQVILQRARVHGMHRDEMRAGGRWDIILVLVCGEERVASDDYRY